MLLILMMACNGCGAPPAPPTSELPPAEPPAPPPQVSAPPTPLPWPKELPCEQFLSVAVAGAELADASGAPLPSTGRSQQRMVDPALFSPAQITGVYPEQDRVIVTAQCSDSRERITWTCLGETCSPEMRRIQRLPELSYLSLQSQAPGPKDMSKMSADSLPMARLTELAVAAMTASQILLRECQPLGCESASTLDRMTELQGPVGQPALLNPSPWKVEIPMGEGRAMISCNQQTCVTQLWDQQGWILRFEQRQDSLSMYLPEGSRLDYRDEGAGPRVVFSGLLFPER